MLPPRRQGQTSLSKGWIEGVDIVSVVCMILGEAVSHHSILFCMGIFFPGCLVSTYLRYILRMSFFRSKYGLF